MSRRPESNRVPTAYEAAALPNELRRLGGADPTAADASKQCLTCAGPMLDFRGIGFNPEAFEKEGTCYRWTETTHS